jgi:hypothetical protein
MLAKWAGMVNVTKFLSSHCETTIVLNETTLSRHLTHVLMTHTLVLRGEFDKVVSMCIMNMLLSKSRSFWVLG